MVLLSPFIHLVCSTITTELSLHHMMHNSRCTCFVSDIDGCARGGAVSSACHSVHSDGVVSAWA